MRGKPLPERMMRVNENFGGVEEIRANQNRYVVYCNYYHLKDLIDLQPTAGSRFLWSKTEPFNPDFEVNFERVKNWLRHFQLASNIQQDKAKVEQEIHASGHIYRNELLQVIRKMDPSIVFPIHTEHPDLFQEYLGDQVKPPRVKKEYEV